MPRQSVGIILGTPTNYDVLAFRYFILALNRIQSIYEFSFPDSQIHFEEERYSEGEILKLTASIHKGLTDPTDYLFAVTTRGIQGNLFFTSKDSVAVITTDVWETYFSPPSLFEYLLHCISASLLFQHPDLHLDSHLDTRGCVLDFTRWKADDRVDIVLGYICDSDTEHIRQKAGDDYLSQMKLVISRKWIGSSSENGTVAFDLKHMV